MESTYIYTCKFDFADMLKTPTRKRTVSRPAKYKSWLADSSKVISPSTLRSREAAAKRRREQNGVENFGTNEFSDDDGNSDICDRSTYINGTTCLYTDKKVQVFCW